MLKRSSFGDVDITQRSRLKYHSHAALHENFNMSHILGSEPGIPHARLMKLVTVDNNLKIQVQWKDLTLREGKLEPTQNVFQNMPRMLQRLLKWKITPANLAQEAREALGLYWEGCDCETYNRLFYSSWLVTHGFYTYIVSAYKVSIVSYSYVTLSHSFSHQLEGTLQRKI